MYHKKLIELLAKNEWKLRTGTSAGVTSWWLYRGFNNNSKHIHFSDNEFERKLFVTGTAPIVAGVSYNAAPLLLYLGTVIPLVQGFIGGVGKAYRKLRD